MNRTMRGQEFIGAWCADPPVRANQGEDIMKKSTPFFARYLENQKLSQEEENNIQGGRPPFQTLKYPSDNEEVTTDKWPSDDDEDIYPEPI